MNTWIIPYEFATSERLTIDYLNHADPIKQIFPRHFKDPSPRRFDGCRRGIVESLLDYNQKLDAPKRVIENIEFLSQPKTFAVITGQQPGLFSGPLYTVYKAISAIVLCERLSDRKHSFVPIFWNASEDHDLSEVNNVVVFKGNEPFKIKYGCESGGVASSHIRLVKSELEKMLTTMNSISPNSEFKPGLLEEINGIIQKSTNVGDFFSRFMVYLLGDLGLVMVEPHYLRELMAPIFEGLIRRPTECTKILNETGLSLDKMGYRPKIHKKSDLCNFFILNKEGRRLRVTYNGKFNVDNETFSKRELLHILDEDPYRFSANAVTRPITQDFLFPTFAYVAGPNEIAYYAQLTGIYDFFSLEMPVVFPRFGATVVEKKVSKVLRKYDVKIVEFSNPERLLKKLAKEKMGDVFDLLKKDVINGMAEVTKNAGSLDKTLVVPCSVARGRLLKTIDVLEDKIATKLKRRDLITKKQIVKVGKNLFPFGDLQERQINVLEYLLKFGKEFLGVIYRSFLEADYGENKVIIC